ncbi:MAG: gamma-glutamyl-gamma-aminobutyrate hydrolase family protein [Clostridium baratii]|uniref:Uncharacterized protein n=1 Tax=Clostridium baratii str. Sullivan TaxID=1415775 RepID=A0A0A7FXF8_9CLOT|nr:gamma-glutamyl-gamma-aminobutyrate hydrolase family protein [Clostridium baratii]AIY84258.1 hypothetical protein U729_976 [Clostridium baratii str. Sullivan]MBS6008072.1 gamma-glutamyl-gamma-aminobutyrate hydrolase family protein [Clostridium baratii]MDU1055035.1 gamma-glutamyl-gamma-aminobutyrate hydrolase family protein [Clostridium baratii]MDU4912232.1 gamma-glutamyl-gamma-aminobutyrate hydrolase family protein [Clostridium baratii]CUP78287.1 peptidase C26 [Clostridium baratii]
MKERPLIGISASLMIDNDPKFIGRRLISLSEKYINAIFCSKGIPFILPISNDIDSIKKYANLLDGLILTGGHDINPLLYCEEPSLNLGNVVTERDYFDLELVNEFEALNKPILGICRGSQVLNVAHGGDLYQDITNLKNNIIKHYQSPPEYEGSHTVDIKEDTILHEILGDSVLVNSYHHQAVKKLGEGFKVAATSRDGIIEAIENTNYKFEIGVQWHPEMMIYSSNHMKHLFNYFINKCQS